MVIREQEPLTPSERVKQVGGWGYRWYKAARQKYRDQFAVDLVPLEEAFGPVDKLHHTPPREVPTPEFRDLPFMAELAPDGRGRTYTIPEDYVAVLHDVLYCPHTNLLLTEDRKIIAESLSTRIMDNAPLDTEVEPLSGCFAPFRSHHNSYFHTLVDNAPRLLSLNHVSREEWDQIKVFCPGGAGTFERFFFERFAPENATLATPPEDRLYRLETVLFTPFKTRNGAGYLPEEYVNKYRQRVLPERPSKRSHRAYIFRGDAPYWRTIDNEEELAEALGQRGFESVRPEELSPEEEVEYFYDATVIAGGLGAGLTNAIFSRHAKVVECNPCWFVDPHFAYLNKSLGHAHGIMSGSGNRWAPQSYTVHIPTVLRLLDRMDIR